MNKVIIVGNLTRDIELRYGESQNVYAYLTIAQNEKFGSKEKTNFIDCVIFGKGAEILSKYASKGSKILIEGRLDVNRVEKDNVFETRINVIVNNFEFLSKNNKSTEEEQKEVVEEFDFENFEINV